MWTLLRDIMYASATVRSLDHNDLGGRKANRELALDCPRATDRLCASWAQIGADWPPGVRSLAAGETPPYASTSDVLPHVGAHMYMRMRRPAARSRAAVSGRRPASREVCEWAGQPPSPSVPVRGALCTSESEPGIV